MKCPVQTCNKHPPDDRMLDHLYYDHTVAELALASCQLKSKWDLAAICIKVGKNL